MDQFICVIRTLLFQCLVQLNTCKNHCIRIRPLISVKFQANYESAIKINLLAALIKILIPLNTAETASPREMVTQEQRASQFVALPEHAL